MTGSHIEMTYNFNLRVLESGSGPGLGFRLYCILPLPDLLWLRRAMNGKGEAPRMSRLPCDSEGFSFFDIHIPRCDKPVKKKGRPN